LSHEADIAGKEDEFAGYPATSSCSNNIFDDGAIPADATDTERYYRCCDGAEEVKFATETTSSVSSSTTSETVELTCPDDDYTLYGSICVRYAGEIGRRAKQ
jgi:hypothetical protein